MGTRSSEFKSPGLSSYLAAGYIIPATIKLQHAPYTYVNDIPGWAPDLVKSKTELFGVIYMQHHKIEV